MIQKTIMIQGKPFDYNDEHSDIKYDYMEDKKEEQARKLLIILTFFHVICLFDCRLVR